MKIQQKSQRTVRVRDDIRHGRDKSTYSRICGKTSTCRRNGGDEYIMQDDEAQVDALQLVCDIFDNMES